MQCEFLHTLYDPVLTSLYRPGYRPTTLAAAAAIGRAAAATLLLLAGGLLGWWIIRGLDQVVLPKPGQEPAHRAATAYSVLDKMGNSVVDLKIICPSDRDFVFNSNRKPDKLIHSRKM